MRISDWSSDVCSSDLQDVLLTKAREIMNGWAFPFARQVRELVDRLAADCREVSLLPNARLGYGANAVGILEEEISTFLQSNDELAQIGRATCEERVCQVRVDIGGRCNIKKKTK